MNHIFHSPRLKINRANQHISDAERLIAEFMASPNHKIITKNDPAAGFAKVVFEEGERLPEMVNLCVGDAVHNLRAALDHVMASLVLHFVPECKKSHIYFPIRENYAGVKGALENAEVGAAMATPIGKTISDVILNRIKPYGTRDRPFTMLNKLDNIDKHRLILTLFTAKGVTTKSSVIGNNTFKDCTFISYNGTPIVTSREMKLEGDFKPAIMVLLDEDELPKYEPLIPALKNISKVVCEAVDAIEKCVI